MFDGEIKSSSYIKKIKVNDNDEYIEINLNDSELLENYTNMVQEISNYSKTEVSNENTEVNSDNIEETINSIKKSLSIHKKIAETVDKYIGDGTCLKVFGVKYPTADSVFEFLINYQDLLEKFTGEKLKSIESVKSNYLNKLNNRRRG
nr:MAG TPA: tail assembly chaperone [Caudoviricetes sp.]